MDYSLRTFLIYRCCNDVNILWQPFYLRLQVQFFLEERVPFMSNEDIKFQDHTMAEVYYIYVDPEVKLYYITLCYNMLLLFFLYYHYYTIGVCLSIVVQADRGVFNCTRLEMEGSGGVREGVLLLYI